MCPLVSSSVYLTTRLVFVASYSNVTSSKSSCISLLCVGILYYIYLFFQYAVLMSEAILFYSPWSSPITQLSARSSKVRWHWILQACSLVSSFTGLVIITANKMINSYSHYSSYHGTIGIFLSGFVFVQTSGGIVEMYPEILPFKVRLVVLKRLHALFGVLTYFCALTTLTLGLFSSWFVANADPIMWKVCLACPTLLGCFVMVQVFRNQVWRC